MENHIGSPGDQQEEDAESEILDDDVVIIDDTLDLMNVSPRDRELGREMRLHGLSDHVLHLQTDRLACLLTLSIRITTQRMWIFT